MRLDLGQAAVAAFRDVVALTCQHPGARAQPPQDGFLLGAPSMVCGHRRQPFDDVAEERVGGRRRIQIVDVAGRFQTFANLRQHADVCMMGPLDL